MGDEATNVHWGWGGVYNTEFTVVIKADPFPPSTHTYTHHFSLLFSVMDGEDLSKYDADISTERRRQNTEDREELDKLEWELASESGRLTGQCMAHHHPVVSGSLAPHVCHVVTLVSSLSD